VTFALRFDAKLVRRLAAQFDASVDAMIEREVAPRARATGYLTKADFLALCAWKSPRSRPRCEANDEEFVRAVTATAFTTPCERLRVESLTLLDGVHWPTASAILHFCHEDPYPVLDVRALWSLGVEHPIAYDFALWSEYTRCCRALARRSRVTMRELDRALWQYAKEVDSRQ
jgi:hypothetical protein